MTIRIPGLVRSGLRDKLWGLADKLDWGRRDWQEKSAQYEIWTRDLEVGGILANYMDHRQIRVYIKDTIMKGYIRSRCADENVPFGALGIKSNPLVAGVFERPHGRLLADGRMLAWGNAEDWKLVLTAMFERCWAKKETRPFGAVLMFSVGKYETPQTRKMVKQAAALLGIEKLVWLT